MYNLGMKNVEENKVNIWVEKYKYNATLTLIIFILFLMCGYSNFNSNYALYINDEESKLVYGILNENDEQYIHIDDLTSVFSNNIYHDKISGKIIITTYNNLKKINKTDKDYTIKKEDNIYFNFKKIIAELGNDMVVSNGKIYVSNNEYIDASITKNRTEIYDSITHDIIAFVEKDSKVKLIVDKNIKEGTANIANVVTNEGNRSYYGYVLKANIEYEYTKTDNIVETDKVVLVKAENKLMPSTDTKYVDMVAIDMYRLSGASTLTRLEYTNNVPNNIEVYAIVNNGQASSNYDPDITTAMLNSESNREVIIQKILSSIESLAGVNVDFGSLKVSDKTGFTQFVRELSAVLHADSKKVIVNVPSTQYIDVNEIIKVADYIVVQPYKARTIASKTSGPISSISYVENTLKNILTDSIESEKIVLEIPAYSILWTERKGTVINAERYNMQMMQEYIKTNGIQSNLDKTSGQNYINYTKGITTYKMWLEDKHSVSEKTKLVSKYNLAGVSIYKSGMELKEIYSNISTSLNK